MTEPVQIERGDLICINVATNHVWLEKSVDVPTTRPVPVPEYPGSDKSKTKRQFPTQNLFTGVKDHSAWTLAFTFAYALTWVFGLGIMDVTELYYKSKDTYVFKVM